MKKIELGQWLRKNLQMWTTIAKRVPATFLLGTLLFLCQPAAAWQSDCVLSDSASVVSHRAADFEIIILYTGSGELDFMGFYLEPHTPHSRYEMKQIRIIIDSEQLYVNGCTKFANGTSPYLCSVDQNGDPTLLRRLDTFMKRGTELSISGAGSTSLLGYTKSAQLAAACG